MPSNQRLSAFGSQSRTLAVLVVLIASTLGGCTDALPTATSRSDISRRRTTYGCVSTIIVAPTDTLGTSPDGSCPAGFDHVPWY